MSEIVLGIARMLGIMRLWRYFMRNRIIILNLHGVMDEGVAAKWVPLRGQYARSELDKSLEVLKRHYRFVSMSDAIAMLEGAKPVVPNAMVLTFDDGYKNNLHHALPILRKHGIPAIMYIAVSHVTDRKPYWFDRLDYALQHAEIDGRVIHINGHELTIDASSRDALRDSYARLRRHLKSDGRNDWEMLQEVDQLCGTLEKESGKALADIFEEDDWSSVMNWTQIKELVDEPLVEIGSHTIGHMRLAEVDEAEARFELTESKQILEKQTGQPCEHFCYPNGSFNEQVARFTDEAGYASAVTSLAGTNSCGDNVMTLTRIHLPESASPARMLYVASGLATHFSMQRLSRLGGTAEHA